MIWLLLLLAMALLAIFVLLQEIRHTRRLLRDVTTHLDQLAHEPSNFARRYKASEGGPCPGCFDAIYAAQEVLR